jgi:hypothetical protein
MKVTENSHNAFEIIGLVESLVIVADRSVERNVSSKLGRFNVSGGSRVIPGIRLVVEPTKHGPIHRVRQEPSTSSMELTEFVT